MISLFDIRVGTSFEIVFPLFNHLNWCLNLFQNIFGVISFFLEELLAAFPNIPLLVHHSIANAHVLRRVQDFPVSYHFTEIKRELIIIQLVWYLRNNTISYYIYDVSINNIFFITIQNTNILCGRDLHSTRWKMRPKWNNINNSLGCASCLVCHFFVLATFCRHLHVIYHWTDAGQQNLFIKQLFISVSVETLLFF